MEIPIPVALILLPCLFLAQIQASGHRSTYIVHMDRASMPKPFVNHNHWYSSLILSAKSPTVAPNPRILYTYDNAFHGFSAVVSADELAALKKSPGFISAYRESVITADTTHSYKFLNLNADHGLWPASEYGNNVIIGVVDSGIWPESLSFQDDGMTQIPARWKGICQTGPDFNSSSCNGKIIGARYFSEGYRSEFPRTTLQLDSIRDTDGHGSHVASIAAGNYAAGASFFGYATGTARGVAPRARLAVYKVLWGAGSGVSSDMLAGIDQAVADGVDIISASLGAPETNLYDSPLSIASFGAREKGILVSFSAGNRGPAARTIRSGIPWAVIVGAGTIDRWLSGTLTLGNGKIITGWTTFPARAIVRNLPLVYNETLSECSSVELLAEAPEGSIIICNLTIGDVDFDMAMRLLPSSNVRAAILIDNDPTTYRFNSFPLPGVLLSPEEAEEVTSYALSSPEPRASIDFQQTVIGTKPRAAPALSDQSSRGPARSYEGILKPDLIAPGQAILGAYTPQASQATIGNNVFLSTDYSFQSGTSMACPHVSGTAALLKAAHPDWSPSAIQSAMMTTANPLDNTNQPIKDIGVNYQPTTPLGIGSGLIDPNRALDPGLVYDASPQDFVNLVCSMNFTRNQTQTIIRSTYNCSNPSSDLNYPSFVALFSFAEKGTRVTRTFRRTVTNVGNGTAQYRAQLDAPVNTTIRIQPRMLAFRKKYEKRQYTLTVRFRAENNDHRPGSITWVEENGKHTVRSPIMVSPAADNFES